MALGFLVKAFTVKSMYDQYKAGKAASSAQVQAQEEMKKEKALQAEMGAYQDELAAEALERNIEINKENTEIAFRKAEDIMQKGRETQARILQRTRRIKGAQIAAMGASGFQVRGGGNQMILEDTDFFGRRDANLAIENARKAAYDQKLRGKDLIDQNSQLRMAASARRVSAVFQRTTGLHSGGTFDANIGAIRSAQRASSSADLANLLNTIHEWRSV